MTIRNTALAIRVEKIMTTADRRYIRPWRRYDGTGDDADWTNAKYYERESFRRETALLRLAPRNHSNEDLAAAWRDAELSVVAMDERVAEDESERAAFGDGPCGSADRRRAHREYLGVLEAIITEHLRRNPPPPPPRLPGDEDVMPFLAEAIL